MGKVIPVWMLGSFFRMGLSPDLEPYISQLLQAAKDSALCFTASFLMYCITSSPLLSYLGLVCSLCIIGLSLVFLTYYKMG